jgi:hypothetical protein
MNPYLTKLWIKEDQFMACHQWSLSPINIGYGKAFQAFFLQL